MGGSEFLPLLREFLFPDRTQQHAITVLDGRLMPNDELEEAPLFSEHRVSEPDDVIMGSSGQVYVSTGNEVIRFTADGERNPDPFVKLSGKAGALAWGPDGRLYICVDGYGLVCVTPDGESHDVLRTSNGGPLECLTSVAVSSKGVAYVTDGSRSHTAEDWVWDLFEQNRSGRLIAIDLRSGENNVLARDLAFPAGICLSADGRNLIMSEAWSHSLWGLPLGANGDLGGRKHLVRGNMPGYPSRVSMANRTSYWLAVFALRTHLVEFVLSQPAYKKRMMESIPSEYWIRPTLRTLNSGLEPLQGGSMKKLGRTKPWAPPRAYGLAVLIDDAGAVLDSRHSRADGTRHGVTSARQYGDTVLIAVKGGDVVVAAGANDD